MINYNVSDPDLINRAILKYEHHPSILKIKEAFGNQDIFSFVHCSYEDVLQEIQSVNISKAFPKTSIPPKIIKDNSGMLPLYIKKMIVLTKLIIYLSASFPLFLKVLKRLFSIRFKDVWIGSIYVDSEKDSALQHC